jgi:hypothetical protein
MLRWSFIGLLFVLTSCMGGQITNQSSPQEGPRLQSDDFPGDEPTQAQIGVLLANLGPAPELNNEIWLNTDQPLSLAGLRGEVVLLEMWTFG